MRFKGEGQEGLSRLRPSILKSPLQQAFEGRAIGITSQNLDVPGMCNTSSARALRGLHA